MSFSYVEKEFELQIELSTVCNASCIGCVRTDQSKFDGAKTFIPKKKYLSRDVLVRRVKELRFHQLRKIEFCGNIDEPLMHPEFLTLLKDLHEIQPALEISIHTNGASRNADYFAELAQVLSAFKSHEVRFSIDGLEETNEIYRRNCKYSKVVANAQGFIQAGGKAAWQFILFPWNQHEAQEARLRAEQMGFIKFMLRKDRSMDEETLKRFHDRTNQPESRQRVKGFSPESFQAFDQLEIDCSFRRTSMMFISWDGKLWPCCFTSNIFYESNLSKIKSFEAQFYGSFDRDFNNMYAHSLDSIIQHPIFKERLVRGWSQSFLDEGSTKLWRCVEKCRSNLEKKRALEERTFQRDVPL